MTHCQTLHASPGRDSLRRLAAVLALAAATSGASAQTLPDVLRLYEAAALAESPALRARALGAAVAEQDLAEARADGRPAVRVESRLTRAEGGRTIDLPLGALLNPAYDALGRLTGEPFPRLDDLARDEADVRARVTVPLVAPAVGPAVRIRAALWAAEQRGVDVARRELVRDVRVAVFRAMQAHRAVGILRAAEALAAENLRAAEALRRAARAPAADVLRAEADRVAAERDRLAAERDRDLAEAALNVLVGRAPGAPVSLPADAADAPPGTDETPAVRQVAAWLAPEGDEPGADSLGALQDLAASRRDELAQLDAVLEARAQAAALARASGLPTLGLAVEVGAQGAAVSGFVPDEPFVLVSLGLSWSLVDGGRRRAQRARAQIEHARDRALREDAALRVRLQVEQAVRNADVARARLAASRARRDAARELARTTTRLVALGAASPVDAVRSRTTLTEAELAVNVDEIALLIERAELAAALGTPVGEAGPPPSPFAP